MKRALFVLAVVFSLSILSLGFFEYKQVSGIWLFESLLVGWDNHPEGTKKLSYISVVRVIQTAKRSGVLLREKTSEYGTSTLWISFKPMFFYPETNYRFTFSQTGELVFLERNSNESSIVMHFSGPGNTPVWFSANVRWID